MSLARTNIDNFVALSEAWGMRALAWNPLTGCTGEGCVVGPKNCWASRRQKSFVPTYWPERAEKILHVREPSIIVCNYLGDALAKMDWREVQGYLPHAMSRAALSEFNLLTGQIDCDIAIREVIDFMRQAPQHTYFWLSKHPERYADFDWPDGTWLGTTGNTTDSIDCVRILCLQKLTEDQPSIRLYAYFEPLLGDWSEVEGLDRLLAPKYAYKPLDWVIVGGKSRNTLPGVKIHKESVAAVVATCEHLGIPVFCKDNLKPVFGAEFETLPRQVPERG